MVAILGIDLVIKKGKIIKKKKKEITEKIEIKNKILKYIDFNISNIINNNYIELIGIAMPGSPKGTKVENIVNLGINEMDFKEIIDKYNIPFQIKNDSKVAGLAEKKFGAMREYNDFVFLCLGTGIGASVFMNGEMLQDKRNVGFELGHMIIDKNGTACNCGKKGCFETYCSIRRFKENAKKILNIKEISSELLVEKIKENIEMDEIKQIIEDYIDNLIIGLSNIIDIFEPEAICLGGSFVYFKDIFYDKLIRNMNERKYVFNKSSMPVIKLAELKNDAGIIGAVI